MVIGLKIYFFIFVARQLLCTPIKRRMQAQKAWAEVACLQL